MHEAKILAISGKAQNGKDTTASILCKELKARGYNVLITHFGDLVKYVCSKYFSWNGNKDEAGRALLQKIGTDIVRTQDPDFWARRVIDFIKFFPHEWDYVLIPDCRFPNEIELLKQTFDYVKHLRVVRPDFVSPLTAEQQAHISETALDQYSHDVLINNISMEELTREVKSLCDKLDGSY